MRAMKQLQDLIDAEKRMMYTESATYVKAVLVGFFQDAYKRFENKKIPMKKLNDFAQEWIDANFIENKKHIRRDHEPNSSH